MKMCNVSGCNNVSKARGWCSKHWQRWSRHGDPTKTIPNMKPTTWEYMLSQSTVNETTGCMEWKDYSNGYGIIQHNNKKTSTHRMSYVLNYGDIPSGMFVCHKCDNKCCINPEHLFLGTHQDNMNDAKSKSLFVHGENHPQSKLTAEDVRWIRWIGQTDIKVAKCFGITKTNVRYIRLFKTWKHV